MKRMTQLQVETRWGVKFWNLIADFADQGLTRFDTARSIGYRTDSFCDLLARSPDKDPFDHSIISLRYLCETGESFKGALERMALEGRTWGYAAKCIGYQDGRTLRRAAENRGWSIALLIVVGRPRTRREVLKNIEVTRGWPTWNKVYEIEKNHRAS